MKDDFMIKIETWHKPDMGFTENVSDEGAFKTHNSIIPVTRLETLFSLTNLDYHLPVSMFFVFFN